MIDVLGPEKRRRRTTQEIHQCHAQTRRVNGSKEPCRGVRAL